MPVTKMTCPKCGHTYNLPAKEADRGFIKCPLCGYKQGDPSEHN